MDIKENNCTARELFISELVFAMNDHDIPEDHLINLTQQNVSFIQREDYSWGKKWPAEGDEVVLIDKIPSWQAFRQMEEFTDSITERRITIKLLHALEKRHPFSEFRYAAEQTGVIQQWYKWIDRWQREQAEEWMHENGIDFEDGRIVADGKHSFFWSWEDYD